MSDINKTLTARVWLYIGIAAMLVVVLAAAWCAVGCDTPPQQPTTREDPTVVYFYEYTWELTTQTRHHCPQPWDTRLYMPGEVVTLHDKQTRYPFLAAAGNIPAPVLDTDSSDTYNTYNVMWRGDYEWKILPRVIMVPNAGIIWVQLNGGVNGDKLRLVSL